MTLLDQKIVGIVILFLLGLLVAAKRSATGSIFDRPQGGLLVQVVNCFNLFFLLIVNPLTAIALLAGRTELIDATRTGFGVPWLLRLSESTGLVVTVMGYLLMVWALLCLGGNYQLGRSRPRAKDRMVMNGPYKLVRHPMYTAALSISLGLARLFQSWAFFGVFGIYLVLILLLIPFEEDGMREAYGEEYALHQQEAKKLVPLLY